VVRKCLNGTAANTADFESQQRSGSVEMNEHMAGLTAKVPLREQCIMGQSRMEERNDGGCEERAAKDFAKFSA
jgi:hypothetical protein